MRCLCVFPSGGLDVATSSSVAGSGSLAIGGGRRPAEGRWGWCWRKGGRSERASSLRCQQLLALLDSDRLLGVGVCFAGSQLRGFGRMRACLRMGAAVPAAGCMRAAS